MRTITISIVRGEYLVKFVDKKGFVPHWRSYQSMDDKQFARDSMLWLNIGTPPIEDLD